MSLDELYSLHKAFAQNRRFKLDKPCIPTFLRCSNLVYLLFLAKQCLKATISCEALLDLVSWGRRHAPAPFPTNKNFWRRQAHNIATTCKKSFETYLDIYTRGKIQQGWKEKGAPFRGGGAKRQIQGVPKREKVVAQIDGNKVVTGVVLRRNGGVFSIKFFTL